MRIHGLQAKPEFNGRDGRVLSIDPESGRVLVDVEAHAGALLRVKPSNLSPSPTPPAEAVAEVTGTGHLLEREYLCLYETLMNGRIAVNEMNHGNVCKNVRGGAAGFADLARLQDMKIIARLTSRMYSEWTSGKLPDGNVGGVYHFLRLNAENTLAHYKKSAPPGVPLPESVKQMYSAWCEEGDVARWGDAASRRTGLFFLVEDTVNGAVMVDEKDGAVYEVFGIKETVCEPIIRGGGYLPQAVTTTLLPWRGRIVYDGVMKGDVGGHITPAVAAMLEARVRRARECGAVVRNISHHGPLSDDYDWSKSIKAEMARAATTSADDEGVVNLAKKLLAFPVASGAAGEMWIMRRFGYTKQDNPRNMLICMAGPIAAPNGPAFTKDLDLTPEEILRYALQCAKGLGGRPKMMGIDHQITHVRVAAALKKAGGGDGDPSKPNAIICGYYPPPSQEETELSIRSGGEL